MSPTSHGPPAQPEASRSAGEESQFLRRALAAPLRGGPGGAASVRSTSELEQLLRRRLRSMAILPGIGITVLISAGLAVSGRRFLDAPGELFTAPPFYGIMLLVVAECAVVSFVLSPRRHLDLAGLRTMEWFMFAPVVILFAIAITLSLRDELPDLPRLAWHLAMATSLTWVAIMVQYGIFIPNTWQRCAAAVGLIALCAIGPDVFLLSTHGVAFRVAFTFLAVKAQFLGFFGALSIYGSHRIDVLQQDAFVARKLGQYELKRQLGAGGMGEVHLAEHQFLRRPCAVKLIRPAPERDAGALARFEREVQVTATLTHPNAVQIFDYGHTDDGTFFYAMEYLPGLSLEELVDQYGPLPAGRAVHFLVQLCGALSEAHGLGLIHRDIKPSNVIICERGGVRDVAKLLDFGLVTPVHSETADPRITQEGVILGTPAFMSPEQCGGGDVLGPASDIYSMGALAYYVLTGRVTFPGRSAMKMLAAHVYEAPAAMDECGVDVPPDIEAAVMRCLEKRPADRFPDAATLEAALATCAKATPWTEREAGEWWTTHYL
ncbi:MAG: serine/threonine-protein kinase [Gemmatimonadales bacterium]